MGGVCLNSKTLSPTIMVPPSHTITKKMDIFRSTSRTPSVAISMTMADIIHQNHPHIQQFKHLLTAKGLFVSSGDVQSNIKKIALLVASTYSQR